MDTIKAILNYASRAARRLKEKSAGVYAGVYEVVSPVYKKIQDRAKLFLFQVYRWVWHGEEFKRVPANPMSRPPSPGLSSDMGAVRDIMLEDPSIRSCKTTLGTSTTKSEKVAATSPTSTSADLTTVQMSPSAKSTERLESLQTSGLLEQVPISHLSRQNQVLTGYPVKDDEQGREPPRYGTIDSPIGIFGLPAEVKSRDDETHEGITFDGKPVTRKKQRATQQRASRYVKRSVVHAALRDGGLRWNVEALQSCSLISRTIRSQRYRLGEKVNTEDIYLWPSNSSFPVKVDLESRKHVLKIFLSERSLFYSGYLSRTNLSLRCEQLEKYYPRVKFFDRGVLVESNGERFELDVALVEWLDSPSLLSFIKDHLDQPNLLVKCARALRHCFHDHHANKYSHGDYCHLNILVDLGTGGEAPAIRLIDVDTFGQGSKRDSVGEVYGKPGFQLQYRTENQSETKKRIFSASAQRIDAVSEMVIYLSLLAYAVDKTLVLDEDRLCASAMLEIEECEATTQKLLKVLPDGVHSVVKYLREVVMAQEKVQPNKIDFLETIVDEDGLSSVESILLMKE